MEKNLLNQPHLMVDPELKPKLPYVAPVLIALPESSVQGNKDPGGFEGITSGLS